MLSQHERQSSATAGRAEQKHQLILRCRQCAFVLSAISKKRFCTTFPRMKFVVFLAVSLLIAVVYAIHVPGTVESDIHSFEKLRSSNNLLVVVQSQSWKEINKFDTVAKELRDRDDILVVRLDGSQQRDAPLKKKYGVESTPSVFFLPKNSDKPVFFTGNVETGSPDALVEWVRVQITPALKELKDLAASFVKSTDQASLLAQAEKLSKTLTGQDAEIATVFVRSMDNIKKSGAEFLTKEKARLSALLENKATTQKKKDEFTRRLHLLDVFEAERKNL